MNKDQLKSRISAAHGTQKADIVLKNGRFFDLVTGELVEGDIAISGSVIVGTCAAYDGDIEIDISGQIAVPGFIDTHLHIESSMVTPFEFDRCVTPRGVTTAICDPHEIANVIGIAGIEYFLNASEQTIMDIFVQLSSCVPSTHMETAGATIDANQLEKLKNHPRSLGLAEFMNYPGVIYQDEAVLDKLLAFQGRHIDGHAPLVRGKDLNAYLAAGIRTDHETTAADEALEKLRKGMHILVREGSVSKDLDALLPIITERNSPYISLCTDDRNPLDIAEHGHLDYMIRHAIAEGATPLAVYRAASISAAKAFGLFDRGLIAPGKRADIVVLDSLESCLAQIVIAGGIVANDAAFAKRNIIEPVGRHSVNAPKVSSDSFKVKHLQDETEIIGIIEGKIITTHLKDSLANTDGEKKADVANDFAKISVVERHGKNGNISNGFVKGFQMKSGAIAASVCHDHHNIAVVGVNDEAMAVAVNHLRDIEGGFVVVNEKNEVAASLALPIAGLMSLEPFEIVHSGLVRLREAARANGITLEEPFLQLAFLCLPVIPHLKITDVGMVDVDKFEVIS